MKRHAGRETRVSGTRVFAERARGNASAEGLTVTAVLGVALMLGLFALREQRRFAPATGIDHASLSSTAVQWTAAGIICFLALGCVFAVLWRFPRADDDFPQEGAHAHEGARHTQDIQPHGDSALVLLANTDSELCRMFGSRAGSANATRHAALPPDAEDAPCEHAPLFRALVHNAQDTVLVVNADATIRFVSASVEQNLGHPVVDLIGRRLLEFVHADDQRSALRSWKTQGARQAGARFTLRCRVRDGKDGWRNVECAGANMVNDPAVGGIVLNARDITERTALEAQLTHRAFHDPLTSLANRALFRDRVDHALARSRREKTSGVVVLFLDLDDFKAVNDTMGHDAGDQLLVAVATKLLNATRGSDTVARLGGDEFAILLENTRVDDEVVVVARRLLTSVSAPMFVGVRERRTQARVGTSIGIARARADDTADTLLRNADLAMYKAKKSGKSRFEFFHPDMQLEVAERIQLEADMRGALVLGTEFHLLYQPIVDLATRTIVGVESLARWSHPQRGVLAPASFMPLAEESGLIVPLGRWILRDACRQASRWQAVNGAQSLGVTINVAARQLRDASFPRDVEDALTDFGIDASTLTLDITESVIMSDIDSTLGTLFALKELGVRLAIDDFGTGHSSLSSLRQFPIDVLKIDKSFVDGVARGGQNSALARTVIALAETLGLRTVAEGIEHADQHDALSMLGCEWGQGFLFARPLPADQIMGIVQGGSATIAASAGLLERV